MIPTTYKEDNCMTADFLWELFLDTGAPEVFIMYKNACTQAEEVSA